MRKSVSTYRYGYRVYVAVEPVASLIPATALTPANVGDDPTGIELLTGEEPSLHVLADSAYGSGTVRIALDQAGHIAAIKAISSASQSEARAQSGHHHHVSAASRHRGRRSGPQHLRPVDLDRAGSPHCVLVPVKGTPRRAAKR